MEFLIVLGSGAFLLGLAFVVWMAVTKHRGQGQANWPHVDGRVLAATVVSLERETPQGIERSFTPLVSYTYLVKGQTYDSMQRNSLPDELATFKTPTEARAVAAKYQVGTPVSVFYNPGNPKQSALEVPKPAAHNAVLFYGVTNMVAGAIIIALGIWLLP